MADLTPSRIDPLGGGTDSQPGTPRKEPRLKSKPPAKLDPDLPPVDDENDNGHYLLDELA